MNGILLTKAHFHCLALKIIVFFTLFMTQTSYAESLETLREGLPEKIMAWTAEANDRIFDEKTIFSYINGGAEVYKAYNMRQCLSRRYNNPNGPAIVLDIFDMGTSEDAFGVFTHDTDGQVLDVGQDSRFRPGWLSFWKNRFFISIYTEEETSAAEKAVKELGRQIAAQIKTPGTRPGILSHLPREGLQSENIRYLHHPIVLNYHYYLSDENILNITSDTDAVLANYRSTKGEALLLVVNYPDPVRAKKALESFLRHYLPDADRTGSALLENNTWAAVKVKERLLAIVLEADSRNFAESLLKTFN